VPQGTYISHALWSPDGKAIFYRRWNESGSRILVRTLEDGQETELLRGDASALLCPHFALSPDGRQLAFGSPWFPGKGVTALNVILTAGGKPRILFKEQGGQELAASGMNIRGQGLEWTPDGRYVLFLRGDYTRKEFWRVAAEGGEPERLGLELASAPPPEFCLHPDGRRIAYNRLQLKPADRELWVLKDFLPE
jgi:Tol biopolymer transport system component